MFKEKARDDRTFNKKEAKSFLKLYNTYQGQRKVHNWKVKEYIKSLEEGTLRKSEIAVALNRSTGNTCIVDGQHRLYAVCSSAKTLDTVLVTYECANLEELTLLYSTFNTDLSRGINDIAAAYAQLHNVNWNPKVLMWVVSYGQYTHFKKFSAGRNVKTLSERASVIHTHIPAGNFIQIMSGLFLGVRYNKAFNNVAIASCIMHMYEHYGETAAIDFWEPVFSISDVVNDVPLEVNDPRRVFRRHIVDAYNERASSWWAPNNIARTRIAILYQTASMHFLKGSKPTRLVFKNDQQFHWEPKNKWVKK